MLKIRCASIDFNRYLYISRNSSQSSNHLFSINTVWHRLLIFKAQNEIFATKSVRNSLFVVLNWTNDSNKDVFCMEMILQHMNSILIFPVMFKVGYSVRYELFTLSILAFFFWLVLKICAIQSPVDLRCYSRLKKGSRQTKIK